MTGSSRRCGWLLALALVLISLYGSNDANAAELTDVLDAADSDFFTDPVTKEMKEVKDPYDFHLNIEFEQKREDMKINREKCSRAETCPDVNTGGLFNKELHYERITSQMNMEFEAAIYKDLEFHLTLPLIFGDQRSYQYEKNGDARCEFDTNPDDPKCVNETNSTVDPSNARITGDTLDPGDPNYNAEIDAFPNGFGTYRYFDIPGSDDTFSGPERSGLGDITLGLDWAIVNEDRYYRDEKKDSPWYRNHGRSTLVVGLDYTAPSAEIARVDNEAVGEGLHKLKLRMATSHRYEHVEPYMEFQATFPFAASETLFKDYGGGQERIGPGINGKITTGMEIIPWEEKPLRAGNSGEHRKVSIDIRTAFGFVAEGREYGPLFDGLGGSTCNGKTFGDVYGDPSTGGASSSPECGWIAEKWANAGFDSVGSMNPFRGDNSNGTGQDLTQVLNDDGITSYEGYAWAGASFALSVQPTKWVKLRTRFGMDYKQDHFITFAKAGQDVRGRTEDTSNIPSDTFGTDGTVSFDDIKERNPVYNPTYDSAGRRFRSAENTVLTWDVALVAQF